MAWPIAELVFEVDVSLRLRNGVFPGRAPTPSINVHPDQVNTHLLVESPVEVLVVDQSSLSPSQWKAKQLWHDCMETAWTSAPAITPNIIIQVLPAEATVSLQGPASKTHRKLLEKWGYQTQYVYLDYTQCGASIDKQVLLLWSSKCTSESSQPLDDGFLKPYLSDLPPRPMSNCLRPPGFGSATDSPPSRTDSTRIPSSVTDTMPPKTGAWIQTPRGYRLLHSDELGKALGVPAAWTPKQDYSKKWVDGLTGIHVWEV